MTTFQETICRLYLDWKEHIESGKATMLGFRDIEYLVQNCNPDKEGGDNQ